MGLSSRIAPNSPGTCDRAKKPGLSAHRASWIEFGAVRLNGVVGHVPMYAGPATFGTRLT